MVVRNRKAKTSPLVSAYERLIHGRGREIGPEPSLPPAVAHALPPEVSHPDPQEGGENWNDRKRTKLALLRLIVSNCRVMRVCKAPTGLCFHKNQRDEISVGRIRRARW
jgi:hypothetical protein